MLSAISKVSTLKSCTRYLTKCNYHASAKLLAVKTFSMPAMSPTMEKGGLCLGNIKLANHSARAM